MLNPIMQRCRSDMSEPLFQLPLVERPALQELMDLIGLGVLNPAGGGLNMTRQAEFWKDTINAAKEVEVKKITTSEKQNEHKKALKAVKDKS